jgi:hypothetical protein
VWYPKPTTKAILMTTRIFSSTEFHLFIEDTDDLTHAGPSENDNNQARANQPPLVLGAGPARLAVNASGFPQLMETTAAGLERGPRFESIVGPGSQPRLLLITDSHQPARVNGLRAPRVSLLSAGDRLRFDGSSSFQVAIYYRPQLGPVPVDFIGVSCPICTIPLAEGELCLICRCGAPFHAADDESVEGALACARMATECPRCLASLQTRPGYQPPHESLHEQA